MKPSPIPLLISLLCLIEKPLLGAACNSHEGRVVDHYISDAILHQRWAVMTDCAHPEQPWLAEQVPWVKQQALIERTTGVSVPQTMPEIAAGEKVLIWKNAGKTRIRMTGTALEPGRIGGRIRVRVMESPGNVLEGTVRGTGWVELVGPIRWSAR